MVAGTLNHQTSDAVPRTRKLLDLLSPIAGDLARAEQQLVAQVSGFDEGIREHVSYVLGASGKRLRPSLALLSGGATGRVGAEHVTLGVIVELIHVATLVHDDVLDEADLRHAHPTANARWGNEISVLVGDCLFAHALQLAAGYPGTEVCRQISQATNTVCAGEILQTRKRYDLNLSMAEYIKIVQMKTGALFAVSCELGAWLNGATQSVVKSLYDYGANLGIAYQIFDDCVDIFGQEGKAGKSLGTDMKKGKMTLPYLLLLDKVEPAMREKLGSLILAGDRETRNELGDLIRRNGVINESLATISRYIERAEASLSELPAGGHVDTLAALLHYLDHESRAVMDACAGR
jgi:octaprenyl-diphosphate synthase